MVRISKMLESGPSRSSWGRGRGIEMMGIMLPGLSSISSYLLQLQTSKMLQIFEAA